MWYTKAHYFGEYYFLEHTRTKMHFRRRHVKDTFFLWTYSWAFLRTKFGQYSDYYWTISNYFVFYMWWRVITCWYMLAHVSQNFPYLSEIVGFCVNHPSCQLRMGFLGCMSHTVWQHWKEHQTGICPVGWPRSAASIWILKNFEKLKIGSDRAFFPMNIPFTKNINLIGSIFF